jgi:hypothetical protein
MKPKTVLSLVLLVFVVVSIVFLVYRESRVISKPIEAEPIEQNKSTIQKPEKEEIVKEPQANKGDVNIVYYFYTTARCPSCYRIETFTKEAVEKNYAKLLKSGQLVWKMINVDEPENTHFIKDYQLFTKSVVLVKTHEGKQIAWKNLDEVWNLLGDKGSFQEYITNEVKLFMEKS